MLPWLRCYLRGPACLGQQEAAALSRLKYLCCYCVDAESGARLLPPGGEEFLGPASASGRLMHADVQQELQKEEAARKREKTRLQHVRRI